MVRIESVRTDAGWHGRIIAENGEPVWSTEVYKDPRSVVTAIRVLVDLVDQRGADTAAQWLGQVDERADR